MDVLKGNSNIEVPELRAGDIGAIAKLAVSQTRDTLSTKETPIIYEKTYVPKPYTFTSYVTKKKGEEDKASAAIKRLMEEDLTLKEVNDKENHQILLYGLGDQHLDVVKSKLADRYKVEIEFTKPRIAYKETIRGKVTSQGKYKKQSGGHGQYGDVKMEFAPSGDLETPYIFEEKIFGGAVPKNYFPAVEKTINHIEEKQKGLPTGEARLVRLGVRAALLTVKPANNPGREILPYKEKQLFTHIETKTIRSWFKGENKEQNVISAYFNKKDASNDSNDCLFKAKKPAYFALFC